MSMAIIDPSLRWDKEFLEEVPMVYVRHEGTSSHSAVLGRASSIWVCKTCRKSEELCNCPWRRRD